MRRRPALWARVDAENRNIWIASAGLFLKDASKCALGHITEGIAQTEDGIEEYRRTGSTIDLPHLLSLKAEALHLVDRSVEALETIREAERLDFGDGWVHEVVVEKIRSADPKKKYAVCLDGENACPLEDCGGIRGYYGLLKAVKNPKHKETPADARLARWPV